MFTVEFPYNIGTFVEVKGMIGTIACYSSVTSEPDEDGYQFTVFVSGYKEPWCRECLLDKIRLLTDEEVADILIGEINEEINKTKN